MYFNRDSNYTDILDWVANQLPAVQKVAKYGVDIEIKPHKIQRSNQQNRFLMEIMVILAQFCRNTGYRPKGLSDWAIKPLVLKEYWKGRYGIETTKNLSTTEFSAFIDWIQLTLVEETYGEWEILTTDSAYLKSLYE